VLGGLLQEYGTGTAGAAWTLGLLITIALCALFNLLIGGARAGDTDPVQQAVSIPETPQPRSHALAPAVPLVARRSVSASPELARWGRDAGR
jgi:hypothetical protein